MSTKTLIKDKDAFISYAKYHTIPDIAKKFGLDITYVKNYVGNHKIEHAHLDKWHGLSNSRLYTIYRGMIARCYNTKHVYFSLYGGRGIQVCKQWREDRKEFFNWALNNGYSDVKQIDRINCDGDYSPDNCRFISRQENQNNRRCTRMYKGIAIGMIVANEHCNPLRLKEYIVYKRVTGDNGRLRCWDIVTALATPVTNVRGSHKVLPVDEEVKATILKGLAIYFNEVLG